MQSVLPAGPGKGCIVKKVTVEVEFAGRKFSLTTGELAKQASGAVMIQYGETSVFVATQSGPSRPGTDFFPLTVDYRERLAAAGRFAGGYLKREGRPTTREVLTSRLTDRPIRPLFPKGFHDEVQIMGNVMSCDGENDPDVLNITAGSAALMISGLPFKGPIAAVRVGMLDDQLILMPTVEQMKTSKLDLIVAGSQSAVLMIEGFGQQIPEKEMGDAIMFAHKHIQTLCALQLDLAKQAGVAPAVIPEPPVNPFYAPLKAEAYNKLQDAKTQKLKQDRAEKVRELKKSLVEKYFPAGVETTSEGLTKAQFSEAFHDLEERVVRDQILAGRRIDGRAPSDLRAVSSRVGLLPRVHGSALFTRGETQSLATATLGTTRDQQKFDGLFGEDAQRFMLHYYFPPFSVGECKPIRGPGRREIGHGCLAERSVLPVIPPPEKFPYTIRIISDILESNGSSSMASVCSATLSLMDAGVPIIQPVAGISIGLVDEGTKYTLLTDIMGDEDHFGDMDFKVAGTGRGVTGIQLDLKTEGISEEIIRATLEQALKARKELLREMLTTIRRPRTDVSTHAPKLVQTSINPEKIGLLIGPGGKTIRAIQEESGAMIDIAEDGTVTISAANAQSADAALARVEALCEEIQPGRIYMGKVTSIKDFGAFIEIAPGKDGLCHISELSDGFVKNVTDVCKIGDTFEVKVIAVDDQNRVKLSRKAVLTATRKDEPADDEE
ncbi:MAG: polyribonucleotide nucleotidyltransferase [Planctomycetales bacterium]|jgi:polyribonucleotide nucleotidyltransferase|nr:polyribonucleotide nucleotidyltransferase [Planctomycetales bacterium]